MCATKVASHETDSMLSGSKRSMCAMKVESQTHKSCAKDIQNNQNTHSIINNIIRVIDDDGDWRQPTAWRVMRRTRLPARGFSSRTGILT